MSIDSDDVRYHVNTYLDESDAERRQLRGELANVRALLKMADEHRADVEAQLAAAEKRAEEAEALLATARDDLDPLRTDLEEYEGQPAREVAASLMADPEECGPRVCKVSVLAALELLEKLESAPTQPQEPEPRYHVMTHAEHEAAKVRDNNGRLYCPTCAADDAEARRDAKMEGP